MSAQVVKGVLHSGLLSNPIRLLNVVTDAAAAMTTDAGMTVSDLVQIGESFRSLSGQNVQFITVPNEPWTQNPNRVQLMQPQASQVFAAIARDMTVPKVSTTPAAFLHPGGAQVLTTSPANVKVEVLNGSGVSRAASEAAAGLTSRGFDRDRHRRRPELRLHQLGHRVLLGRRHGRGEHPQEGTHQRHLPAGGQPHPRHRRPDPRLRLHRACPANPAGPAGDRPTPTTGQPRRRRSGASPSASASSSGVAGLAQSNGGITAAAACYRRQFGLRGPAQSLLPPLSPAELTGPELTGRNSPGRNSPGRNSRAGTHRAGWR